MHICFITIGDIKELATSKRALGLANILHTLGWNVSIILEDALENRRRVSLECNNHITIQYFNKGSVVEEIKQKKRLLQKLHPDFIYYTSFSLRNFVGFSIKAVKLIEHSELLSKVKGFGFKRIQALITENISIIYADGLICASRYLVNEFEKRKKNLFILRSKIFYSPYAYNKTFISNRKLDTHDNQSKLTLLFIGSLVKNYGLFTLLYSINEVAKHNQNIKLVLVGDGADKEEAIKFIKSHDLEAYIDLKGYVDEEELDDLFSKTDVFLAPLNDTIQDWARCPSKIFMYLPYAKPVFTCRIGEALEIFGEKGFYFNNSNPNTLTQLILSFDKSKEYDLPNSEFHTWDYRGALLSEWICSNFKTNQ